MSPFNFAIRTSLLCLGIFVATFIGNAQETKVTEGNKPPTDYKAEQNKYRTIFRSTRLVNFQTVETLDKGSFDLRISHRLGDFKSGFYEFWGLDKALAIKFGFDYSITDNITVGYGRNNSGKLWEGFAKWRFLRQREDGKIPLTMTAFASINITSRPASVPEEFSKFGNRMSFVYQLMFARQFGKILSLQVAPTLVHYNQVERSGDKNDQFILASMARLRLTRSLLLIGEYGWRLTKMGTSSGINYHNSAAFGLEIQTSGHSFQLFVTNSNTMNESQFLAMTTSDVLQGEVRLGFNISRVFKFGKKK
ncbi:MAG: hypothetical protein K1X82_07995 [Bacteroidia bacterium]|nr:hypothetical protein [Bacteroidia bacterium]